MNEIRNSRPALDRRGLTMVEMMISLALFAVAMTVVFSFLVNSRQSYSDIRERVLYQQSMRAVMSLVSKEVRSAGCDPEGIGFMRFAIADAGQLHCRMDLDGDGVIEFVEPAENVIYRFVADDGELVRNSGVAAGNQTILRNVNSLVFSYFDEDGDPLGPVPLSAANRANIRFVEIDITGETARGESVNYVTRVHVRNS